MPLGNPALKKRMALSGSNLMPPAILVPEAEVEAEDEEEAQIAAAEVGVTEEEEEQTLFSPEALGLRGKEMALQTAAETGATAATAATAEGPIALVSKVYVVSRSR
jgi:hypothetical protein